MLPADSFRLHRSDFNTRILFGDHHGPARHQRPCRPANTTARLTNRCAAGRASPASPGSRRRVKSAAGYQADGFGFPCPHRSFQHARCPSPRQMLPIAGYGTQQAVHCLGRVLLRNKIQIGRLQHQGGPDGRADSTIFARDPDVVDQSGPSGLPLDRDGSGVMQSLVGSSAHRGRHAVADPHAAPSDHLAKHCVFQHRQKIIHGRKPHRLHHVARQNRVTVRAWS